MRRPSADTVVALGVAIALVLVVGILALYVRDHQTFGARFDRQDQKLRGARAHSAEQDAQLARDAEVIKALGAANGIPVPEPAPVPAGGRNTQPAPPPSGAPAINPPTPASTSPPQSSPTTTTTRPPLITLPEITLPRVR